MADIEPLLVTYNDKGQVEGVKYDRIGVVLINAIKELEAEKNAEIKRLGEENAALRKQYADLSARLKAVEQGMQSASERRR